MEYKGLRWYKCDFHLHTMRSECYKNRENDTIDMWVDEVKNKGIQCIAITDHNDYRGIDEIKSKAELNGIWAFPGVELSCDSNKIHLLIIFDIVEGGERVQEFLNQVGIFSSSLGKSEITCSGDIFDVCQKAHNMGALVIAAHIDEYNGICEISYHNIERILNRDYIDAVQIVNEDIWKSCGHNIKWESVCETLSGKYGKTISDERAKQWYKAYSLALESGLPMLTFSDNPSSEGEASHGLWGIGRTYTWLKMNESPNLESIRQALLSYDMRLKKCNECKEKPDIEPELWIKGISFCNTSLNEKEEVHIHFNPQLNTIIGGRGSGKSSIIRLLAGGMESFDADKLEKIKEEQDSFYQEQKRDKHGILKGVFLKDSKINIFIERAGDSYKITIENISQMHAQDRKLFKEVKGEWIEVEDRNFLEFFKAQIYTQKQIYEIALDSNSLLSIIDEDIAELTKMISERDNLFDNVVSNYLTINNLEKRIDEESMIQSELADIEEQIKKYERSGISDSLKEKQESENVQKGIDEYFSQKENRIESICDCLKALKEENLQCPEINNEEIKSIIEKDITIYNEKIKSIEGNIVSMRESTTNLRNEIESSKWIINKESSERKYSEVVNSLQEQGINLEKLDELLSKKKSKIKDIEDINTDKKRLINIKKEQEKACNDYAESVRRISEKRSGFIHEVIGNDSNVKFDIQRSRNRNSFIQMVKSVLGKGNATIDESIERMADIYFGRDGKVEFLKVIQQIREGTNVRSCPTKMRNAIIELQPESYARMIYYIPEDDLKVSYKPENSERYIPLSNASAGQKTTAILTFLLAYGEMPLLLDQPEDDLDNKLVYDLIVTRLKKAKTKRQIIVVTHNANIPVNADAEHIISMNSESEDVNVRFEGTMDDTNVRKEICDVMEGTKYAFEMRAKKYHFNIVE